MNKNVVRDQDNQRELDEMGWSWFVAWECEIAKAPVKTARTIEGILKEKLPRQRL